MTGVRVVIDKASLKKIQRKLDTLASFGNDLRPALAEIGDYMVSITTQRFRDSKDPAGTPWKPVKRGGRPLVDRGNLRNLITYNADSNSVEIGSGLIYAAIHQLGGRAGIGGSVKIDPRPFLGVSQFDEIAIDQMIETRIQKAINE